MASGRRPSLFFPGTSPIGDLSGLVHGLPVEWLEDVGPRHPRFVVVTRSEGKPVLLAWRTLGFLGFNRCVRRHLVEGSGQLPQQLTLCHGNGCDRLEPPAPKLVGAAGRVHLAVARCDDDEAAPGLALDERLASV